LFVVRNSTLPSARSRWGAARERERHGRLLPA
jgi:hypothetical protein